MKDVSEQPSTRYAKGGNVHVAYQVFGAGDIDLVFLPGFVSNIEIYWEEPHFARWLQKLAFWAGDRKLTANPISSSRDFFGTHRRDAE